MPSFRSRKKSKGKKSPPEEVTFFEADGGGGDGAVDWKARALRAEKRVAELEAQLAAAKSGSDDETFAGFGAAAADDDFKAQILALRKQLEEAEATNRMQQGRLKKGIPERLAAAEATVDLVLAFRDKDTTVIMPGVAEQEKAAADREALRAEKVAELLPGGNPPGHVQLWLDKKHAESGDPDEMRAQAAEPTKWLLECFKHGYLDDRIRRAAESLVTYDRFTPNLEALFQWAPLQAGLKQHLAAYGEQMKTAYDRYGLDKHLTDPEVRAVLGAPSATGTHGHTQTTAIPFLDPTSRDHPKTLDYSTPAARFTSERVALHVLMLVAIGTNKPFQDKVWDAAKCFLEDDGGMEEGPLKTFVRPLTKGVKADYSALPAPRVARNLDLIRCLLAPRDIRSLFQVLRALKREFGAIPKWKNLFGLPEADRAARSHLVSIMLTLPFVAEFTYGQMAGDAEVRARWAQYAANPQGEPRERWDRDVAAALAILRSKPIAKQRVAMLCEVQVLLKEFVRLREQLHDAYQAARPSTAAQLHQDFVMSTGSYEPAADAGTVYGAASLGQRDVARRLVAAGADKDQAWGGGATPLYVAANYGHTDVVELLVGAGADKDEAARSDGATPLFIAADRGHADVVELLAAAGADKDKAEASGATPLYVAAQNGHADVVELLAAAGADKDKAMPDGRTPLFMAAHENQVAVVQVLVEAKADLNRATKIGDITPISIAAKKGYTEVAEILRAAGAK